MAVFIWVIRVKNSKLSIPAMATALKRLRHAGIEVAVITGRRSEIVQQRMTSLTVPYIYQGQENKLAAFAELQQNTGTRSVTNRLYWR